MGLIASEADIAIEEQFENICSDSVNDRAPKLKNTARDDFHLQIRPLSFSGEKLSGRTKLLSTSASGTDAIDYSKQRPQRAMSMPKRNTTLSTFWKLVDKHGLKPIEPILYLPDTNDMDTLNARLRSGDIEFEELSGPHIALSKMSERLSDSHNLSQEKESSPASLQKVVKQRSLTHHSSIGSFSSEECMIQSRLIRNDCYPLVRKLICTLHM